MSAQLHDCYVEFYVIVLWLIFWTQQFITRLFRHTKWHIKLSSKKQPHSKSQPCMYRTKNVHHYAVDVLPPASAKPSADAVLKSYHFYLHFSHSLWFHITFIDWITQYKLANEIWQNFEALDEYQMCNGCVGLSWSMVSTIASVQCKSMA